MLLFRKTAMPWAGPAALTQQEACMKMWAASRPAWPRVAAALALLLAAALFPVLPAAGQTPFKVALGDEMQLRFQTVDLNAVLQGMRGSANLVFLDACWDNPFVCSVARSMGTRSSAVGRGLAQVEKDRDSHGGTFIAFATAAGELASDGEGRNSPFTAALKKHIGTPGLVDDFYFSSPPSVSLPMPSLTEPSAPRLDPAEELDSSGRPFRDCADCPEMVVVPPGSFLMGSPSHEAGRYDDEGPVHRMTIGSPFAVGVYEVTVSGFGRFVDATGHSTGNACYVWTGDKWKQRNGFNWRSPGFEQGVSNPAVCVSWGDALAYVIWLSRKTGIRYRLPSEAEWEYASRAGTRTARWWGEGESGQCAHANGADASTDFGWKIDCSDGHSHTAPVGSFRANAWGLHDVLGNAWEWTRDCWNGNYTSAPSDFRARVACRDRVLRGGSWFDMPWSLRSATRLGNDLGGRLNVSGFRVARALTP